MAGDEHAGGVRLIWERTVVSVVGWLEGFGVVPAI